MYEVMDAHVLTMIGIAGTALITPFFVLATWVSSGASREKGLRLGAVVAALGGLMLWVCMARVPAKLGLPGNLIVPLAWVLPSLLLALRRDWFFEQRLSQRWLIGLQIFRVIGAFFLLEMVRGNLPGVFAYPAGIGDVIVALVALGVLLKYREAERIPGGAIYLVVTVGMLDFAGAFFFGFFSSETPVQLFFPETTNNVLLFPTGMIPLFLVPYAIFFHTLSWLNHARFERGH